MESPSRPFTAVHSRVVNQNPVCLSSVHVVVMGTCTEAAPVAVLSNSIPLTRSLLWGLSVVVDMGPVYSGCYGTCLYWLLCVVLPNAAILSWLKEYVYIHTIRPCSFVMQPLPTAAMSGVSQCAVSDDPTSTLLWLLSWLVPQWLCRRPDRVSIGIQGNE